MQVVTATSESFIDNIKLELRPVLVLYLDVTSISPGFFLRCSLRPRYIDPNRGQYRAGTIVKMTKSDRCIYNSVASLTV